MPGAVPPTPAAGTAVGDRALRRSEERLRLAMEAGGLGVWAFDLDRGTADWSAEALAMYGGFDAPPTPGGLMARVPAEDRPLLTEYDGPRPGESFAKLDVTHRVVHPDGTVRWVRARGEMKFHPDGRPRRSVGTLQDVTEQLETERALREANERLESAVKRRTAQLRTAARRLADVGREERDRIAHILHDHFQQLLVGAKMLLAPLRDGGSGEAAESTASVVIGVLDEAIDESRVLAVELSPPVLREQGLPDALRWLAKRFTQRHGLGVDVSVTRAADDASAVDPEATGEPGSAGRGLPEALAFTLFEAARELLLNVVKHAEADHAWIRLTDGETLVLEVRDDGVGGLGDGFGERGAGAGDGFGMSDLRQRIDLLDGTVHVESTAGEGTTVRVTVPAP